MTLFHKPHRRSTTGMEVRRSTKSKHTTPDPVVPVSTKKTADYLPKESWWTTTDRAAFAARREQEQARMAKSPFGGVSALSFVPPGTDTMGAIPTTPAPPKERPKGIIGAQ